MRELEEQLELARYAEYDNDSDSEGSGSEAGRKGKMDRRHSGAEQGGTGVEAARKIDQLEAEVRPLCQQ